MVICSTGEGRDVWREGKRRRGEGGEGGEGRGKGGEEREEGRERELTGELHV